MVSLKTQFNRQKQAFNNNPMPGIRERKHRLEQLALLIKENKQAIVQAISDDFGHRSEFETLSAEVMTTLMAINNSQKKIKHWLKTRYILAPLFLQPISSKIIYQPLGVVGIMVPWNYPLNLALNPLVDALAAGNNIMIKMSEFSPKLGFLLESLLPQYIAPEIATIINGEVEVSMEFSKLNFDLLFFTGSIPVGKMIQKTASENLTPVVLELGGKSPALIDGSFNIKTTAERLVWAKTYNSGQTCVAPDYVLVQKDYLEKLRAAIINEYNNRFPDFATNKDVTSIINIKQFNRLVSYLNEVEHAGQNIDYCQTRKDNSGKLPLTLLSGNICSLRIMKEEIFGPLLPLIAVDNMQEAIRFINERPRPLAAYAYSSNKTLHRTLETETHSGALVINDAVIHFTIENIPIGGIGNSGMGHYHGHDGFLTFSNAKPVIKRGKINPARLAYAPYDRFFHKLFLKLLLK